MLRRFDVDVDALTWTKGGEGTNGTNGLSTKNHLTDHGDPVLFSRIAYKRKAHGFNVR